MHRHDDPRRALAALWPLLVVALWICGCRPPEQVTPLQVEYAGCAEVHEGPVCLRRERDLLRLWLDVPATATIRLEADGRILESRAESIQGGSRYRLEGISADTSELKVTAVVNGSQRVWQLALARRPKTASWYHRAWVFKGSLFPEDETLMMTILDPALHSRDPGERAQAAWLLANHRWETSGVETEELFETARAARHEAGQLLGEIREAATLVWLHLQSRRMAEARAMLDDLLVSDDLLAEDLPADALYLVDFYRGLLAEKTGESRSALHHLRAASARAERLGLVDKQLDSEQVLAWHLQSLGRSQEAAQIFAAWRSAPPEDPCDLAQLLNNHAWSLLLALEAGDSISDDPIGEDPVVLLESAIENFVSCGAAARQRNALVNLALANLHAGHLEASRQALKKAAASSVQPQPLDRLWTMEIEARLHLAAGENETALGIYDQMARLAIHAAVPEARWRAAVGRGRTLTASDRPAAISAFAEAERLLDEESLQVPIHDGRESFAAQRLTGTRLYLDLLLRQGRIAEAFEVARRSRNRLVRGLQRRDRLRQLEPAKQKQWNEAMAEYSELRAAILEAVHEDWELPVEELERELTHRRTDEEKLARILDGAFAVLDGGRTLDALPELVAGELVLAYHPLAGDEWVGFAVGNGSVTARRFEDPSKVLSHPPGLSERILGPFAEDIESAPRLRILSFGPLRGVDFHALSYDDDLLLASKDVVYGLDIQVPTSPPRTEVADSGAKRALVVADPNNDLRWAREEANTVREILSKRPDWDVFTLAGREAGTEAVRLRLAEVDLLHYAGHGTFAGRGGWQSALELAGARLTLSDILTIDRSPRWVVLSACEAARSDLDASLETPALAQAFLSAGSRQVIAAMRPVDDEFAAELIGALYQHWQGSKDLATALREAQLEMRQNDPRSDWASFRVLEP